MAKSRMDLASFVSKLLEDDDVDFPLLMPGVVQEHWGPVGVPSPARTPLAPAPPVSPSRTTGIRRPTTPPGAIHGNVRIHPGLVLCARRVDPESTNSRQGDRYGRGHRARAGEGRRVVGSRSGHQRVGGVTVADIVTGPFDVIARVEADSLDELGKMVVSRIQAVKGVRRTLTCPVITL